MVTFLSLAAAALSAGWDTVKSAFQDKEPVAVVQEQSASQSERYLFVRRVGLERLPSTNSTDPGVQILWLPQSENQSTRISRIIHIRRSH